MCEVLDVVQQERDRLAGNELDARELHKDRSSSVVSALGGEELLAARRAMTEAADRMRSVGADVDQHNKDLRALSFWGGLFKRRRMARRAEELDELRREAITAHEQTRVKAEGLLKALATPDNIVAAFRVSREMRSRFRAAVNTKKHLGIKRRLLLDNLDLCKEIDALLALIDESVSIQVSESDLQTLMRDPNFRGLLSDLVTQ